MAWLFIRAAAQVLVTIMKLAFKDLHRCTSMLMGQKDNKSTSAIYLPELLSHIIILFTKFTAVNFSSLTFIAARAAASATPAGQQAKVAFSG